MRRLPKGCVRGTNQAERGGIYLALVLGMVMPWLDACGISPRIAHQGSAYFEHCNAADLDPARSMEQRRECWAAWLEYYAGGQPADRQRYARDRFAALADGQELAALGPEDLVSAPGDTPPVSAPPGIADPASAAPPVMSDVTPSGSAEDAGAATPESESRPVEPPPPPPLTPPRTQTTRRACSAYCEPRWDACVARCQSRDRRGCVEACEAEYRFCSGACP